MFFAYANTSIIYDLIFKQFEQMHSNIRDVHIKD